jgi:hypothetical protein
MRTVICHFFNEAYLLPWWLQHHTKLFDYGVMIDHGSTDASADIVREMAPNWRLVRSRLTYFDAYLTDFEVMGYEQELPGWKIALNVTEFLMPGAPLPLIEGQLQSQGRKGCAASGIIVVDHQPGVAPVPGQALPLQKHWGFDDNAVLDPNERQAAGLTPMPYRNRFYHCDTVGMYHPGRHRSFHHDSLIRMVDLMVFHFGYAPWNDEVVQRKTQIKAKLKPDDVKRGWGLQHMKDTAAWNAEFERMRSRASDLREHPQAGRALQLCAG